MAQKWNFKKQEYEEYNLPYKATTYQISMSVIITCAACSKELLYGNGYTSRTIHTEHGMGYAVCSNCYQQERAEEIRNKEIERKKENRI